MYFVLFIIGPVFVENWIVTARAKGVQTNRAKVENYSQHNMCKEGLFCKLPFIFQFEVGRKMHISKSIIQQYPN